jgi:hypothetical protein
LEPADPPPDRDQQQPVHAPPVAELGDELQQRLDGGAEAVGNGHRQRRIH